MGIKDFIGKWHIYEMEERDKDYIDEEVKAYIRIEKGGSGLVCVRPDRRENCKVS